MESVFLGQEGVFSIVFDGRVIGSIGIIPDPKRGNERAKMLGYAIGKAYWGKGLMTEAAKALIAYGFSHLGAELISAYCFPHNKRSARVLEKCGFQYEGTLHRSEQLFDGTVCDEDCYVLFQETA